MSDAGANPPLGYAEPREGLIVEYEDDVLRALDHEFATFRDDDFGECL